MHRQSPLFQLHAEGAETVVFKPPDIAELRVSQFTQMRNQIRHSSELVDADRFILLPLSDQHQRQSGDPGKRPMIRTDKREEGVGLIR